MSDLITRDPPAVALLCQRMMDALNQALVAVPHDVRRTSVDFSRRPRGVLGRARAWFHVSEVTGRKVLHFHGTFWAGAPQWLTQRCAGAPHGLCPLVSHPQSHLQRLRPAASARGALAATAARLQAESGPCVTAPAQAPCSQRQSGLAVNVATNVHSHCPTYRRASRRV
jgi:hypothetical protein